MKIEVPIKAVAFKSISIAEVFDYSGNHMMRIKIIDERFDYNSIRLSDATFFRISEEALVTPLPNAKLVIE